MLEITKAKLLNPEKGRGDFSKTVFSRERTNPCFLCDF